MTGAALIDNHLINDPIFTAYGADGYSPLPGWIWGLVGRVHEATMEAARRAGPTTSHIFTNYLSNRPSEGQFVQELRAMAAERRAQFVPVWLTCPEEELIRRVGLPGRQAPQKMRDPDGLWQLLHAEGVLPAPPDALVLDTSTMSPRVAAQHITNRAST
jgi:hypothetical protein